MRRSHSRRSHSLLAARALVLVLPLGLACGAPGGDTTRAEQHAGDREANVETDIETDIETNVQPGIERPADPFADAVVLFEPGPFAGFGQDQLPDIVLGPPRGAGDAAGGTDVLSLGKEGVLVLEFTDIEVVDGPGPDLLVFENPFTGWIETAAVSVSLDGETWHEFPCAATAEARYAGCAGVRPVYAHPDNEISPVDPDQAGGDAFDLADVGLARARFVRLRDTGTNPYAGVSGGFDLDALAVVNGAPAHAPRQ